MVANTLMGLETEFGPADLGDRGAGPGEISRRLLDAAASQLVHLPGAGSGIFLGSGARLMIDVGAHLEFCTPEVSSPTDLVVAARAGEAVLRDLLDQVPGAVLSRSNQCYLGGATYGSHENYCMRGSLSAMQRQLIPHLVSRFIYTGAGGLDPWHPGIDFVLSPRATHHRPEGGGAGRALLSGRDEPLAGPGYRRLHVTLGDTLLLDTPLYLRFGTTALLVALVEAGLLTSRQLPPLDDPNAALAEIVHDTTLESTVALIDGSRVTALQLQQRMLEIAESACARHPDRLPDWAPQLLDAWRCMLDTLARNLAAAPVDWVVKRAMFEHQFSRAGFDREEIALWSRRLRAACRRRQRGTPRRAARFQVEDYIPAVAPLLERWGRTRADLERFVALRQRLCQLDFLFGALPGGPVDVLRTGMNDSVEGVTADAIRLARRVPPGGTRASVRGGYIRRLNARRDRYIADWAIIVDQGRDRYLAMDEPWSIGPGSVRWQESRRPHQWHEMFGELSTAYNRGHYGRLLSLVQTARTTFVGDVHAQSIAPYEAWGESRTGNVDRAVAALDQWRGGGTHEAPGLYAAVYRFQGLQPSERIWPWIARGDATPREAWSSSGFASFLGHKGYALKHAGRLDEAIEVLQEAVAIELRQSNHQRINARNRCDLADCLRIVGRGREAGPHLQEAWRILTGFGFVGERADHYLTTVAKRTTNRSSALASLERARRTLRTMGNPVGLARVHLLRARISGKGQSAAACRRRVLDLMGRVPDLRTCPKLRSVLRRWDAWTGGEGGRGARRDWFWGL